MQSNSLQDSSLPKVRSASPSIVEPHKDETRASTTRIEHHSQFLSPAPRNSHTQIHNSAPLQRRPLNKPHSSGTSSNLRYLQELTESMAQIYKDAGLQELEQVEDTVMEEETIPIPEPLEEESALQSTHLIGKARSHATLGMNRVTLQSLSRSLKTVTQTPPSQPPRTHPTPMASMTMTVPEDAAAIASHVAKVFFENDRDVHQGVLAVLPNVLSDRLRRSSASTSHPSITVHETVDQKQASTKIENPKPPSNFLEYIQQQKQRLDHWITHTVLQDDYPPDTTPEQRLDIYLSKRITPRYQANLGQLIGLGVTAVITGEFFGWNGALRAAGFGGFLVSIIIAGLMYFCLALCLAELTTALPVVGGSFAFARAMGGNVLGFITGNAENVEYAMFVSLLLVSFSDTILKLFQIDPNETLFGILFTPVLWILFLGPCIYMMVRHSSWTWNTMRYGAYVTVIQIVLFCLYCAFHLDTSQVTLIPQDTSNIASNIGRTEYFPSGFGGVLFALPTSAWFYTGFECLSLTAKESLAPSRDLPRAMISSWFILSVCAILIAVFNVLVPPGAFEIAQSDYPMSFVINSLMGNTNASATFSLIWMLPASCVNMLAMLFCASRQFWALSRAGYLPHFLSISVDDTHDNTPARSIVAASLYSFAFAALTHYARGLHGSVSATDVLTMLTIISGCLTYSCIGITYLMFSIQYPQAPRPYKSPMGRFGAILLILISSTIIIAMASLSTLFTYTLIGLAVKMGFSAMYFGLWGRLHLLPTEDRLLQTFWVKKQT